VETTKSGLKATQVGNTFAAVVENVDFSRGKQTPEVTRELEELIWKYGILIFRKTGLDNARHIEFTSSFGPLDSLAKYAAKPDELKTFRLGDYRLYDAGNVDNEGNILQPGDRMYEFRKGNVYFHCDSSFQSPRQAYSLLRANVCPPAGPEGDDGNTCFADSRTAYHDMPQEMKDKIKDLVGFHDRAHSRKMGSPDYAPTEHESKMRPGSKHKIVQKHPCGTTNMYIGNHCSHIVGMPKEEGFKLVQELIAFAAQDKYVYDCSWDNPGDLVMWDNRTVMHRSKAFPSTKYYRDLVRTSTIDTSDTAYGEVETIAA